MRCCAGVLLSLFLLLTSGCGLAGGQARFEVSRADISTRGSSLDIRLAQDLRLSPAASRAIRNGVPVRLLLTVEVRDGASGTLLATEQHAYDIRFLPMSRHFQLTAGDELQTFPRLRHVLRELSVLRMRVDAPPLAPGDYELRARLRLDRASLPAPMQLPSLVSRAWRHDSDWSQWPFTIGA